MAKLNRSELLKFADLTSIKLSDQEADKLLADLDQLLCYTDELLAVKLGNQGKTVRNINTLREDVAISSNAQPLLAQAPEKEQNYFVVPKIVDHDKEPV